jgi:lipid-A-disaccharide synthase-like uncharacterized protein
MMTHRTLFWFFPLLGFFFFVLYFHITTDSICDKGREMSSFSYLNIYVGRYLIKLHAVDMRDKMGNVQENFPPIY